MRRQDELIALYQGRGRYAQKYLLSQMGRLALAFDSEELLEFLQGQIGSDDPVVANQALFSLLEFLPAYVHKRYAIKESTSGVWTQLLMDTAATQALLRRAERMVNAGDRLTQAAQLSLGPLADALIALSRGASGWTRTSSLVTLGQFDLRGVRAHIESELARGARDLVITRAAKRVTAADGPDAILEIVRREGPTNPDLYLLLCGLPAERMLPVVMDAVNQTDTTGRMNLAQAVGTLRGVDLEDVYERLTRPGEGWVIVQVLDAIEQSANPKSLARLVQIFRAIPDDFVRGQVVRAAGGLPGGAAKDFALAAAKGGSEIVRAVALETLARQGVEPGDVAGSARALLESTQLKARVNAILAFLQPGEVLEHRSFSELMMSEDPLHRLEAAYVLGYLQSPRAVGLLTALSGLDPSPSVRQQAAKSLSRYSAQEALPHLLAMIQGAQPRHALTAARTLSRYAGRDAAIAVDGIVQALDATQVPIERALLYRALGLVAQRQKLDAAKGALAAGLAEQDPLVLSGVLEGWNLVGAAGESTVLTTLKQLSIAEPRLRARALMALWSAGEVEALDGLAAMIASGDEKSISPALECALEVGLLLPDALTENRFPELAERMLDLAEQPELPVRAAEALSNPGVREERREIPQDEAFSVRRAESAQLPPEVEQQFAGADADATLPPDPEPEPEPEIHPRERLLPPEQEREYAGASPDATLPPDGPEPVAPVDAPTDPNATLLDVAPTAAPEPPPPPPAPPPAAPPPLSDFFTHLPRTSSSPALNAKSFDVTPPRDDADALISSVISATPSRASIDLAELAVPPAEPAPEPPPAPPPPPPPAPPAEPIVNAMTETYIEPEKPPAPPVTLVDVAAQPLPATEPPRRPRATQRLTKPRMTSSFRAPDLNQSGGVENLKSFLNNLDGQEKSSSIGESLARATYLITDRVAGPAAAASPARKVAIGAGLGTLIVGLVFLALSFRTPEESAKVIAPLWVETIDGAAQWSNGKAVAELAPVPPGESLKTGPTSVLTLVTDSGGKVIAQPNSSVVYVGVETEKNGTRRHCFKDAAGEVNFDFRKGGDMEFRAGPRRVKAGRAHLLVTRERKAPSLTVVAGTGYLTHDKGGETIILRSGDTIGLE